MATQNITTLREFIAEYNLSPEDGGLGLAWFRPDEMFYRETRTHDREELHIFSDGSLRCGLLDTTTTSVLLSEDELIALESEA